MKITTIPKIIRKPKVGAYVRVSSLSESQEDSFEFQSKYWNGKFVNDDSIEYVGLYTDEGISGKSMRNRRGLNALLDKVRRKEIDRVYTKSISRFARNYTETLEVIRELRDIGVPIIFEKENINTLDPKCGLMLTVFSSLAEQELISMSKNQKWAKRNKFAKGGVEYGRLYGYDLIDGKLNVNETEAKGVRRIFELYLGGVGMTKIAQILDNEGYKTKMGLGAWSYVSVRGILTNEKYIGDSLLQKSIYNLKSRKVNTGELPQYYVEGTHEAIIAKSDFQKVNERIKHQRELSSINRTAECVKERYSGKIKCGKCGASYKRKIYAKGKSYEDVKWICRIKNDKTAAVCNNHEIKDEVFRALLIRAYNECLDNITDSGDVAVEERKLQEFLETEREFKQLYAKGYVTMGRYLEEQAKLLVQIKEQEEKLKAVRLKTEDINKLRKSDVYTEEMSDFLISATIGEDWTVTFEFANGYKTIKTYTNGRAGNVNGKLCKYKT